MAIVVSSDPRMHNTIIFKFKPGWTWTDFFNALDQERELVTQFNGQRYDVIANFEETSSVPIGNALGHVRNSLEVARKYNRGMTVVVSRSGYIRVLINSLVRSVPSFRSLFMAVDSFSDAYKRITEAREAENGK
jgi:hypothetical protein